MVIMGDADLSRPAFFIHVGSTTKVKKSSKIVHCKMSSGLREPYLLFVKNPPKISQNRRKKSKLYYKKLTDLSIAHS